MPEVSDLDADRTRIFELEKSGTLQRVFWVIAAIIYFIMIFLSHNYGLSGDEWLQMHYGNDIWNYYTHGDQQALNYNNLNPHYYGLEYYGGLFDLLTETLHHLFPAVDYLNLRHFVNALFGATLMVFTGLLAHRLCRKWSIAILAVFFMFLSPRIFGESMNNPKDIPFASGFIIAVYFFTAFLQQLPKISLKYAAGLAIGFAVCFGVRFAGGLMLLTFITALSLVYYIQHRELKAQLSANKNALLKKAVTSISAAILVGYVLALIAWPWGLQSPIDHPFSTLKEMANRQSYFKVLFEGVYRMNYHMPWYYELKWILMTSPVIVIAGVIVFIALVHKARKKYGLFAVCLLLCCAFMPLIIIMYKHSTVYDTWRHVFFTYSFWAVMAALGINLLGDTLIAAKYKAIPLVIATGGLIAPALWIIESHPNQYVYFNELAGGVKGAYGYYDLDYYQNSARKACNWIKTHAPRVPGRKLIVLSNMQGIDKYFEKESDWITVDTGNYEERHKLRFDYFITNGRYIPVAQLLEHKWPPQNVVYEVSIDHLPLCAVLVKKSYAGNQAFNTYKNGDYKTAASKYAQYLKTDSLDEYAWVNYALALLNEERFDEAISALTRAISFNPNNASYYDGLKGIYELKGDDAKMHEAAAHADAIRYEEQELNPPLGE